MKKEKKTQTESILCLWICTQQQLTFTFNSCLSKVSTSIFTLPYSFRDNFWPNFLAKTNTEIEKETHSLSLSLSHMHTYFIWIHHVLLIVIVQFLLFSRFSVSTVAVFCSLNIYQAFLGKTHLTSPRSDRGCARCLLCFHSFSLSHTLTIAGVYRLLVRFCYYLCNLIYKIHVETSLRRCRTVDHVNLI